MPPMNIVDTFQVKSYDSPDEKRRPSKSVIDIVTVGEYTLGRFTFEPGWKWSECIKPVVQTDSCQNSHVGVCVSGGLTVRTDDGEEKAVKPGDAYTIPPGHDAWVTSAEPFVGIEFISAATYATRSE